MDFMFYFNAILFGIGLAMDAFSVSLANGLNEPKMKTKKSLTIATVFGVFQFLMPMIGWILVHSLVETFNAIQPYVPWIALVLLLYIGGKMLIEALFNKEEEEEKPGVGFVELMVQGVATSIDALSVGLTIANFGLLEAFVESFIIGVMTTILCLIGIRVGKEFGTKYAKPSAICGGLILIGIGVEIFLKGVIL